MIKYNQMVEIIKKRLKALKILFWNHVKHGHKWYFKETDHHGTDRTKRFCSRCELEQWLFMHAVDKSQKGIWKDAFPFDIDEYLKKAGIY